MSDPFSPNPTATNAPEPAVVQPSAPAVGSELQPNIAAALACFFSFVGGLIFLILEKKNRFVRFYAMQSLLFGAFAFVVSLGFATVNAVFGAVLGKIPVIGSLFYFFTSLIFLALFVGFWAVSIITILNAFKNKEWEIPYLGPLARRQLISGPLSKL